MRNQKLIRLKTQCILLQNLKDWYKEVCNIIVTNKVVRCLGIFIGRNKEQCYDINWTKIYVEEKWQRKKYLNHRKQKGNDF